VLVLIAFGAVIAPLVTSVLMAGVFSTLGLTNDFWMMVAGRTLTDAFAVIALVPLIVHGYERLRGGLRVIAVTRAIEAGVLAVCVAWVGFFVFVYPAAIPQPAPAVLYAPLPFLVWAVMRFGTAGACGAALLLGGMSTWSVLNGHGPFTTHDPIHNALSVVTFQATMAGALLIFSALLSEFRRAEAGRKMAESLHVAVLRSLHDQIAILDSSGTVIEINDSWGRFVEMTEPPRFDCVPAGRNFLIACEMAARAGDPAAAEELEALRVVLGKSEVRRQFELSESTPAGPRWFEVSIEQLRQQAGGAVITRTDVTARKRAEIDARNQHQQLAHLGRAAVLGELSGAFAHELNQPLTSILGNAEAGLRLLARNGSDLTEIKAILHDIVQDDERAAQVIQRLRDLLRKGEMHRQPVNLNTIIHEVLQLAHSELITRNVCVTTDLDSGVPAVAADRVQMQQIILNLIMNACEAMMGTLPPERRLCLSTRVASESESVEVTIRDSGCGIAGGDVEHIFQPFVTTKPHGMGLGLAICRTVAEAHHGRLWAENATSGGAVFRLSLPVGGGILQ
jgi:C4-dicarboxylate-specific signal transduction histidine kinase